MNPSHQNQTPQAVLDNDSANLYLGNRFTVDNHLTLPLKGLSGSTISWSTSNPLLINENGRIFRPSVGSGNGHVTLTATLSYGGHKKVRTFDVTILAMAPVYPVESIQPISILVKAGSLPDLPTCVITVLQDHNYSTAAVTWAPLTPDHLTGVSSYTLTGSIVDSDLIAKAEITVLPVDHCENNRGPKEMVYAFPLDSVEIFDSVFSSNSERSIQYLLKRDPDQMLYVFRQTAGLDTKGACPLGGWDSPQCNLRGHTTGHYLSALAQAYKSVRDNKLKQNLWYMVDALGHCQDVLAETGRYTPGFLSGYTEDQFILLESLTPYPEIWAPYYTLHKLMAGLLDAYTLAGNEKALTICLKMGHFVYKRLSQCTKQQRNTMWATYIAGEFGGLNEVMAKLYGLSGDPQFLEAARYFDNDRLYLPMSMGYDTLGGLHANQHIPQVIGALELSLKTGEPYYYHVAHNFWRFVTSQHLYSIGGTGSGELFQYPHQIARYLTDKTAETCATYNLLKLTRLLYATEPHGAYMDYYEKALYNHIVASQDKSADNGGSTYFMPLSPGAKKDYFAEENSCCHGTGMENHTKYQEAIYYHTPDHSTLYVNLYIASTLNWREKGVIVRQTGHLLIDQKIKLTFDGSGYFNLKLRLPKWASETLKISVCGRYLTDMTLSEDQYITLSRFWSSGDTIELSLPFTFRLEKAIDDSKFCSLCYGPLVMVAISPSDSFMVLPLPDKGLNEFFKPTDAPLIFTDDERLWMPLFMVNQETYHAYFKQL